MDALQDGLVVDLYAAPLAALVLDEVGEQLAVTATKVEDLGTVGNERLDQFVVQPQFGRTFTGHVHPSALPCPLPRTCR
jgi:hypothetical protein